MWLVKFQVIKEWNKLMKFDIFELPNEKWIQIFNLNYKAYYF